jgi:hypothetical protein
MISAVRIPGMPAFLLRLSAIVLISILAVWIAAYYALGIAVLAAAVFDICRIGRGAPSGKTATADDNWWQAMK